MVFRFTYDGSKIAIESIIEEQMKFLLEEGIVFHTFNSSSLKEMIDIVNFVNKNLFVKNADYYSLLNKFSYVLKLLYLKNDKLGLKKVFYNKICDEIFNYLYLLKINKKEVDINLFDDLYQLTVYSHKIFVRI